MDTAQSAHLARVRHLRPAEVQYVLDDCGATALVASEAMAEVIAELDLARIGPLVLAAEGQVVFVAGGPAHLEVAGDMLQVEDGDRNRIRHRDRIAQVDERMDARQLALLAQAPQQRFGCAAVLRGLQPHQ